VPICPDETFTDITWAAVVKGSSNSENATKLIEFMIAEEQQSALMYANGEAPASRNVDLLDALRFLYDYTSMHVNYEELGRYTIPASMMMNIAGWQ
jgi:ABC-type thiamine transport system substrate-binding protein